ncbi:NADH-quinone oxidoreductase subunit G [Thermoflexales bacterium]|nr:NADH-quinone oxidoreductase subunit G [Thermoflexales bacterium]
MADLINLFIDDVAVSVPKGTLIVDAAKRADIDIPVFCYHPKLKPVGMCRMCLVQVGRVKLDRGTGQPVLDANGSPEIAYGPKLETSCTTPVEPGMRVITNTDLVKRAQKDVLEFLLTSHPLDCPICDKGGECPLQNLTLTYGPGVTRFDYADKQHLDKHYPLGELIFLDKERCIQCARCIRFQDEIADDHVLGFYERGRKMQIETMSTPGFDSKFSGNTTDICPVGALTTRDFRFRARPWEITNVPSICPHCPVGCNISLGTRRSAKGGGEWEILRVMPRQNEAVNEIWICDKGRFGHHYARSQARLQKPLIKKEGRLVEATWEEAFSLIADRFRAANGKAAGWLGDRVSNEDAWLFGKLFREGFNSAQLVNRPHVAGLDLVARYGVGVGTNLGNLGQGDVVFIVAGDVEETAPVHMLRLKAAVERGAKLIVANARETKMDRYAAISIQYQPGMDTQTVYSLLASVSNQQSAISSQVAKFAPSDNKIKAAGQLIAEAQNLIVMLGDERPYPVMVQGQYTDAGRALAQACANLVVATGHIGKANNGLLPLWPHNNTQGVYDMLSAQGAEALSGEVKALYLVGTDPIGEGQNLPPTDFVVVQELFLTPTAQQADVVLPALAWAERDGTFTNAERRVQRYYKALPPTGQAKADWEIFRLIAEKFGLKWSFFSAEGVMHEIAAQVAAYAGLDYVCLAETKEEWPPVGTSSDLYFGGTAYDNRGGVGAQTKSLFEINGRSELKWIEPPPPSGQSIEPRRLNRPGTLIDQSAIYEVRLRAAELVKIEA